MGSAMTYRGHIEKGVVIFDEPVALPNGTKVNVTLARMLAERLRSAIGVAKGLPPDLARNHDHYLHGRPKHGEERTDDEAGS